MDVGLRSPRSCTSHLFTSRLHLVCWSSALKIENDLPIFASYAFVIVSLTWLAYFLKVSVTWLSVLYKFTQFIYLFSVSLWQRANARNVRLYYPYWQYTDLFIFRFVSSLCLRSTLRLFCLYIYNIRNIAYRLIFLDICYCLIQNWCEEI